MVKELMNKSIEEIREESQKIMQSKSWDENSKK
mgnify:CR=1 FL=1